MLLTFTKSHYEDLEIKPKDIMLIVKAKNDYIKGLSEESVEKCDERQITREFWKPQNKNLKYKVGNFISHEIKSSSLSEASREFKSFTLGELFKNIY